jgi:hypothetical protein
MEWCGAREARIQSRHAGGQRGSSATDTTKPPHAGEAGSYSGAHTSAAGVFFFFFFAVTAKCPDPRNSLAEPVTASHAALRLPGWEENQAEKKAEKEKEKRKRAKREYGGRRGVVGEERAPRSRARASRVGRGEKSLFPRPRGLHAWHPPPWPCFPGEARGRAHRCAVGWVRFSVAFAPQQGGPAVSQLASRWGPPAPVSFFSF